LGNTHNIMPLVPSLPVLYQQPSPCRSRSSSKGRRLHHS
jgi:hypothetical protein